SEELASYCLSCHRCDEICSTRIPIADLVRKLREKIVREKGGKAWKKAAFGVVLGRPQVERRIFALGRAARPLISKEGRVKWPLAVGVMKRLEKFPAPAEKSFTALVAEEKGKDRERENDIARKMEKEGDSEGEKERVTENKNENKGINESTSHKKYTSEKDKKEKLPGAGKKVAIFPGCLIENFFPEAGLAAYRLLRRHGYEVEVPFDGCCGFPAANSGYAEEARKEFGRVAEKLLAGDHYRVVTLCPTCTAMLKELGPELTADIMLDEKKAAVFRERVKTFVSFVAEEGLRITAAEEQELGPGTAKKIEGAEGGKREIKITYHDSCHHKFVLKEAELSRRLLREAGYELVEMEQADVCCGFAGVFSVEHAEVSEELLRQKLEAIEQAGAEMVVMDCPGCILQIKGGLLAGKKPVKARHSAELL
ncbi:MAG: (Fe-S)-binding protein, partial [Candidatus Saccharicenans sp.]|nr:(Fe-S)-binding protein [Candidatus Saccharicenans sp.]